MVAISASYTLYFGRHAPPKTPICQNFILKITPVPKISAAYRTMLTNTRAKLKLLESRAICVVDFSIVHIVAYFYRHAVPNFKKIIKAHSAAAGVLGTGVIFSMKFLTNYAFLAARGGKSTMCTKLKTLPEIALDSKSLSLARVFVNIYLVTSK